MNVIDTNIFLYSIDRNEPAKQLKAQQLLQRLRTATDPTFLLWQALGELVAQLRRWTDAGRITPVEFATHVPMFRNLFPLVLPTPVVLDRALDLASRYSISHWDSMMLGACKDPVL